MFILCMEEEKLFKQIKKLVKQYPDYLINVENEMKTLKDITVGEGARNKERFSNKKAENYFKLMDLFNSEQIKIPKLKDI